jgi:DNA-binding XRE family transcriptional regulator/membrane protein YdbS with pleckstrin-like domain
VNKESEAFKGTISRDFVKKEALKNNLFLFILAISLILTFIIYLVLSGEFNFDLFLLLTLVCVIIPYLIIAPISAWYFAAYKRSFSYIIQENNIVINHGVFTKMRATIPYKRIQNINIVCGVFDRIFKTYTVKIETAGHSAVSSGTKSRGIGPEGYIPGLKDPHIIENRIKEMIFKSSLPPEGLEENIFKPNELAFDNFISYILSKMREGELLQTSIKELRENAGMSASQLAESVGVPLQTIQYLEEGRYNPSLVLAYKIAEVLDCTIEELFKLK